LSGRGVVADLRIRAYGEERSFHLLETFSGLVLGIFGRRDVVRLPIILFNRLHYSFFSSPCCYLSSSRCFSSPPLWRKSVFPHHLHSLNVKLGQSHGLEALVSRPNPGCQLISAPYYVYIYPESYLDESSFLWVSHQGVADG
jgi:hypothetical protein